MRAASEVAIQFPDLNPALATTTQEQLQQTHQSPQQAFGVNVPTEAGTYEQRANTGLDQQRPIYGEGHTVQPTEMPAEQKNTIFMRVVPENEVAIADHLRSQNPSMSANEAYDTARVIADNHNKALQGVGVTVESPKPASQLSNEQLVTEVRELHSQFKELSKEYEQTPAGASRDHLREEMKPIISREHELREEYVGRIPQQINQDRTPAEITYSW